MSLYHILILRVDYVTFTKVRQELKNHEGTKNTKEEKEEEELRGKNDAFNAFFEDGDVKIDEKTKRTISHF
jgi:hypothetical protein